MSLFGHENSKKINLSFNPKPLYAVMADVDGLKLVNDHLGHEAGDMLLCRAARLLQTHVRKEDVYKRQA